ncbi:MAG: PaaI family thioesterase [Sphingomicrobium sp.]
MSADSGPAPGTAYALLIGTLRRFLDAISYSDADVATMEELTTSMSCWIDRLGPPQPENDERVAMRYPLPSRGRAMCPPFVIEGQTATQVSGTVVFGSHFLGRNGAAHGGSVAILFDEVFGHLANTPGQPRARTAHLEVDYLRITPVDQTLRVEATAERQEGRKLALVGTLFDDQRPCARASGLMVILREGQP